MDGSADHRDAEEQGRRPKPEHDLCLGQEVQEILLHRARRELMRPMSKPLDTEGVQPRQAKQRGRPPFKGACNSAPW